MSELSLRKRAANGSISAIEELSFVCHEKPIMIPFVVSGVQRIIRLRPLPTSYDDPLSDKSREELVLVSRCLASVMNAVYRTADFGHAAQLIQLWPQVWRWIESYLKVHLLDIKDPDSDLLFCNLFATSHVIRFLEICTDVPVVQSFIFKQPDAVTVFLRVWLKLFTVHIFNYELEVSMTNIVMSLGGANASPRPHGPVPALIRLNSMSDIFDIDEASEASRGFIHRMRVLDATSYQLKYTLTFIFLFTQLSPLFLDAFLGNKCLPWVCNVVRAMNTSRVLTSGGKDHAVRCLFRSLYFVTRAFEQSHQWIAEAMEHRILENLVRTGLLYPIPDWETDDYITATMAGRCVDAIQRITAHLIYRGILHATMRSLRRIRRLGLEALFEEGRGHREIWHAFLQLKNRAECLWSVRTMYLESGQVYSGCSYSKCEQEGQAGVYPMSCTGCTWSWYCSRDCQRKDWARHKAQCMQVRSARNFGGGIPICNRDLHFVNFVKNVEIDRIAREADPDPVDPLVVQIDYTSPQPEVKVDRDMQGMFSDETIERAKRTKTHLVCAKVPHHHAGEPHLILECWGDPLVNDDSRVRIVDTQPR